VGASGRPGRYYLLVQNIRNMSCSDNNFQFDADQRSLTPDSGFTAETAYKISLGSTFIYDKGIHNYDSGQYAPAVPPNALTITSQTFSTPDAGYSVPSDSPYTVTYKIYSYVGGYMTSKSVARLVCSAAPRTMTEFTLENLCLSHDPGTDQSFEDCFEHTVQR
jgi:hypothetical protein